MQTPLPVPLAFHACVTLPDAVSALICGGDNPENCYVYNSVTNTVTAGPMLNVKRWILNLVNYKGSVYAMGGADSSVEVPHNTCQWMDEDAVRTVSAACRCITFVFICLQKLRLHCRAGNSARLRQDAERVRDSMIVNALVLRGRNTPMDL